MTVRAIIAVALAVALSGVLACGLTAALAQPYNIFKPAPKPQVFPSATDVRLGGDDRQTRFVLDFSQKVDLAAFTLADPYRVVVDLPQITFKLPPKAGESGRGLIKAFRYGLVMQGGSRIVLDTKGPVRIEKAFMLERTEHQPARLVIDLAATDRDSFMRNIALENRTTRTATTARKNDATPSGPADPRQLIVIDPGHGGIDNGTKAANGTTEKSIVLDFALMLRDKIEKSGKYRVAMTRTDDSFVPLGDRVSFARARQAGLFISVHADYIPRSEGEAHGASVYTLSENATDSEAARLAENENKADVIAGVDLTAEPNDVADILIDLAQRETKTFSVQFARTLVEEMKLAARMHKHPVRAAGFKVLRAPDVPSVLVELGFVSTKSDLSQMMSAEWRSKTADSVARAVDVFFTPRLAGTGAGRGSN